ncbi:MAG: complex I subunit 1/NuoH family protein, partial [Phycisphaeraceae bacterium]
MPAQVFISIVVIAVVIHAMLLATAYLIYLERKVSAWAQDRLGPNRTSFTFGQDNWLKNVPGLRILTRHRLWGLGQALADGVKLLIKEDYTPPHVEKTLFILAPMLAVIPALIGWAIVPWGGRWDFPGIVMPESFLGFFPLPGGGAQLVEAGLVDVAVAPVSIGVIYILAISSLAVYGVVLAGYASNNKYSFLGGLRATAQMLSYEIPMGVIVLIMILLYHSPDARLMVDLQAGTGGAGAWGIFLHPLLAIIFFTAILAETNRAPFDLAEAEQELVGGFHTEYSSMKWALFFLGEYMHMITGSAFFIILFLGGWDIIPFVGEIPIVAEGLWGGIALAALKTLIFAAKVALLLFVMMWIRWTLPRLRFDQLMKLAWVGVIPLTIVMLLVTGVLVYLDAPLWAYPVANLAVALLAAVVTPLIPAG